jgi:la-related protein 6
MNGIIVFELVLPKKKTGKKAVNMTKMIENFKYNSESENERSRGGENILNNTNVNVNNTTSNSNRFYLKRNNSGSHFVIRPDHQFMQHSPRKMSLGNENSNVYTPPFNNFVEQQQQQQQQQHQQQLYEIPARRLSNGCISLTAERKYSNCSDGYSTCSEALSRRQSMCSDVQRRLSNCSTAPPAPQSRRSSVGCMDYCSCGGSRRMSAYSNVSNDSFNRRISNASMNDFQRKFSTGSSNYNTRKYSNVSTGGEGRRMSFDRRNSGGSIIIERKYSNGFDPMRKLSQTSDYYVNGRKISTDSGYDRRMSINSITYDNENPIMRSRNNSFNACNNHMNPNESLIRKPIQPDGESKGFAARTRKVGLINNTNAESVVISQ